MITAPTIIRPFQPSDRAAFKELNLAWINQYFTIEPEDIAQLEHPEATILDKGGCILIAEQDAEVVGTTGLIPAHRDDTVELVKMAVKPGLRGGGIGQALMNAALSTAREMGASTIWLETHTSLKAAKALYEKAGFVELPEADWVKSPYSRCNCQMRLSL